MKYQFIAVFIFGLMSCSNGQNNANELQGEWLSNCFNLQTSSGDISDYVINELIITESMFTSIVYYYGEDMSCTVSISRTVANTYSYEIGSNVMTTDGVQATRMTFEPITAIPVNGEQIFRVTGVELNFGFFSEVEIDMPTLNYEATYLRQ